MLSQLRGLSISGGRRWGAVVGVLGVVFAVVELLHVRAMSTPFGIALEAVLPFLGSVALVAAGYHQWAGRYSYDDRDVPRVVGWFLVGMVGMGAIFVWVLAHQLIRGGTFHHAHFILVNNLIAGGLIGFLVGTYDARSQTYRRAVHAERLKHAFLNRELHHHIRNGMTVILGHAETLADSADSPRQESVATIRERGAEIVNRVADVQTIASAFTERAAAPLATQDLSGTLRDVVDRMADRYDHADVAADVPDGVTVRADQYLPVVFENVLANAVEHNDADTPRVRVTVTVEEETAVVRVADDGPGIPPEQRASIFTWDEPTGGDIGMGVGLAIVTALVDRYGGRVQLSDNDPTGTVVRVELRRAT